MTALNHTLLAHLLEFRNQLALPFDMKRTPYDVAVGDPLLTPSNPN
jgi:hypothetical protein